MAADAEQQIYDSILSYIRDKSGDKRDFVVSLADQILKSTGHVPIVTNIASGTGICYYIARLSEAIGVKRIFNQEIDRFSGKGSDTHKILGLASLYLFTGNPSVERIPGCVERAISEVEAHLYKPEELDAVLITSMMQNLVQNLDRMLAVIGADVKDMVPIVEQPFIDYIFHMRGTPDLILEDPINRRALVVDWKTGEDTPTNYESAQITCYALMEARRLRYGKADSIDAVLGSYENNEVKNVKVLPIIVRPQMPRSLFKPHPALGRNDPAKLLEQYQDYRKLICDICLEAEHLTILITNQEKLTGIKAAECQASFEYGGKTISGNILRFKPRQLPAGIPAKQEKFPCVSRTGTPMCKLIRPCKFYFGAFQEKDDFNSTMWKLRFGIFDSKEKDLLAYRGLHEIFRYRSREQVIEALRNGKGIRIRIGNIPEIVNNPRSKIEIIRGNETVQILADVLDWIGLSENRSALLGRRNIREHENERDGFRFINEGKPVLITPVDSNDPLLSISLFGRTDDINFTEDGRLEYAIRVPSKVLNYQMLLFQKYLELRPTLGRNVLMFQTNVDLTQMELNALDALHQRLNEEQGRVRDDQNAIEEINIVQQELAEVHKDVEENEQQTIERSLREIIDKGTRKSGFRR